MTASAAERMTPSLQFMVIDLLSKSSPTPLSTEELAKPLVSDGPGGIDQSDVEDALGILADGGVIHRVPAEKGSLYLMTRAARLTMEILNNEHLSAAELAARTGHA